MMEYEGMAVATEGSLGRFFERPSALHVVILLGICIFFFLCTCLLMVLCVSLNRHARAVGIVTTVVSCALPVSGALLVVVSNGFPYFLFSEDMLLAIAEAIGTSVGAAWIYAFFEMIVFALFFLVVAYVVKLIPGIFLTIYAGMQFKTKAKGFSVLAFIILLIETLFLYPLELSGPIMQRPSLTVQIIWYAVYCILSLLPLVLLLVQAIIVKVASIKEAKLAAQVA